MLRTLHLLVLVLVFTALGGGFVENPRAAADGPETDQLAFFEQKIRPVLVKHCYPCHSEPAREAKKLQGGLYLDTAEGVRTGGENGPAIVPHRAAESLLIKALRYDGLEMPPAGKLPDDVVRDFSQWIDAGAADPRQGSPAARPKREIDLGAGKRWWSFQPLTRPMPPERPAEDSMAAPIDRFLMERRQQAGLKSNPAASKEKLLRRAYFDLVGLPPPPEEVEAFLRDESPHAFEAVVDRLLNSPHYGEKWARHWLDTARYAESGGYEFDGFRPGAYAYRDWVIAALNRDLPYDEFLRMQLAGDRMHPDSYDGAAATGFLVAGPYPGQITAKTVERIRYDQLDDMLMTIGGSMLGLTLGCVRCHEHKYDPIPHRDYYALAAALAQTVHGTRTLDVDPIATRSAHERHQQERERLADELRNFSLAELPQRFRAWQATELSGLPDAPRWQVFEPLQVETERSWWKARPGGVIANDGQIPPGAVLWRRGQQRSIGGAEQVRVTVRTFQKNVASLRLEALSDKSLPQRGPGLNGDGSFQLTELKVTARPLDPNVKEPPQLLRLKPAFVAAHDKDQPLEHAVDGKPETAWIVRTTAKADNAAVFELDPPLAGFAGGTELVWELSFQDQGLGRMRLSFSTEPNPATWAGDATGQQLGEIRSILAANNQQLPASMGEALVPYFSSFDGATARIWNAVRDHAAAEPRPELREVYTTTPGGQDVYYLRRGEVDNKDGKSEPGYLQVLLPDTAASAAPATGGVPASGGVPAPSHSPADPRLQLAQWVTDVERGAGALVARVMVNRLWQHHFGRGLVATPNDFGAQGELPTHPELLEWLAAELVDGGWKLKPLHKQIMLSAAYRQANAILPENMALDPANRLWWHFPTRRLDAELIRDALLSVGGNLDPRMNGPSILDDTPRRSIYLRVKRSELIPFLTQFDAPEPTQSIGQRTSTTLPTQALTMMNAPLVRQQAERLAQRIWSDKTLPLDTAVERAYVIALARRPVEAERARMLSFLEQQQAVLGSDAAATEKGLVEFCHVLLCLNEFIYID